MNQPPITLKKYELPALPYALNALEPIIQAEIMELHYHKHHQTYLNNLNKALEQYEKAQQNQDLTTMTSLLAAIKFNGGGHLNHALFWANLAPKDQEGGVPPVGTLAEAIDRDFGSLQNLIDQVSTQTIAIQGSGWGWLGYDPLRARLAVATCDNQDPLAIKGLVPLLGIDVWEHAYYLQYKNVRADYVKAIWSLINWKSVAARFEKARHQLSASHS